MVDVLIRNEGSVVMVIPQTEEAKDWVEEHVMLESWQWIGGGFAVGPRYLEGLLEGMREDALEFEFV